MSFPQNDQTDGGQSDLIAASTIDQCVGPRDRRDLRGWSEGLIRSKTPIY